jgi:hypothetical protein
MEGKKPLESWGHPISENIRHSIRTVCTDCYWEWGNKPRHVRGAAVVGFSKNPPFPSKVEFLVSIGAFVIECPRCFSKFWFHIEEVSYVVLERFFIQR